MEILTGQRQLVGGSLLISDEPYHATGAQARRRTGAQARRHKVRYLPEEPLRNACAPNMSVADNRALRLFDEG